MSNVIMGNGFTLYNKEKQRNNINPLNINIFGDDFRVIIEPETICGDCGIALVDFDENQNKECQISISFDDQELEQLISFLQLVLNNRRNNIKMINVISSKIIKRFKCGYNIHEEVWNTNGHGPVTVKLAYTPDGEYIGSIEEAKTLCNTLGIKPQKINKNYSSCNIGFSEKNQKWYAWSHRGIREFGIGSEITKNSDGYKASNSQELYEQYTKFDQNGIRLFDPDDVKITKTGIRITIYAANSKPSYKYIKCGKGEWKAKTLADAKLMAIITAKRIV